MKVGSQNRVWRGYQNDDDNDTGLTHTHKILAGNEMKFFSFFASFIDKISLVHSVDRQIEIVSCVQLEYGLHNVQARCTPAWETCQEKPAER